MKRPISISQPERVRPTEPVLEPSRRSPPLRNLWALLRTLLIGSVGLTLITALAVFVGSALVTANQRSEADKAQPWADPSFITTAVTTGGMLARWMDNDGDLSNGHTYIKGIYDLWKVRHPTEWRELSQKNSSLHVLPQLWQSEFENDYTAITKSTSANVQRQYQASSLSVYALPNSTPQSTASASTADRFEEIFSRKGKILELTDYTAMFREEALRQGISQPTTERMVQAIQIAWKTEGSTLFSTTDQMLESVDSITRAQTERAALKEALETIHRRLSLWAIKY